MLCNLSWSHVRKPLFTPDKEGTSRWIKGFCQSPAWWTNEFAGVTSGSLGGLQAATPPLPLQSGWLRECCTTAGFPEFIEKLGHQNPPNNLTFHRLQTLSPSRSPAARAGWCVEWNLKGWLVFPSCKWLHYHCLWLFLLLGDSGSGSAVGQEVLLQNGCGQASLEEIAIQ